MQSLWNRFDRIIIFDTETTGVEPERECIIELGAVALEAGAETSCFNRLIRLPEGRSLPPFIVELTGITEAQLAAEGVSQNEAAAEF